MLNHIRNPVVPLSLLVIASPLPAHAQDCLDYLDRTHCAGLGTELELVDGELRATAADETPLVRVTTSSGRNFGTRYSPVHFETDRTNAIAVANVGTVESIPDQTLGNLYVYYFPADNRMEATGSCTLTADGITIEIRHRGVLVDSAFSLDGTITASTLGAPALIESGMVSAQQPYFLVLRFEAAVEWSVHSVQAVGDELVFIPAGRVRHIDALEYSVVEGIFIPEFTIADEYGIRLRVIGDCPGSFVGTAAGATPGEMLALAAATDRGDVRIPFGPCAGTLVRLGPTASVVFMRRADASGFVRFTGNVPPQFCGRLVVQAIDVFTCATSNAEVLP